MTASPAVLTTLSRVIGGKAAALTVALDAGLPVPAFHPFTVAQAAFLLDETADVNMRLTLVKEALEHVGGGSVAVRSSAQNEDGKHSFAGQFESRLGVSDGPAVLDAIKAVIGSACSARLAAYAAQTKAEAGEVTVLVQHMVEAQAAGVSFSRDPLTFQPEVVVEAVRGPAGPLVSGMASPTRAYFDRDSGRAAGVDDRAGVSLPILEEAAALALSCEGLFGRPQDIEWAWDGDRLWLLQSRPLTGFADAEVFSDTWSKEVWPGLIKPLVFDVGDIAVNAAWGRILTAITGPMDVDWRRMAGLAASRAYFNETLLDLVLARAGMPPNILETVIRHDRPRMRDGSPVRLVVSTGRLLRFLARHVRWLSFLERELPPLRTRVAAARTAAERLDEANLRGGADPTGTADWGPYFTDLLDLLERASYLSALTTLSMGLRSLSLRLATRVFSPKGERAPAVDVPSETAPLRELMEVRRLVGTLAEEERVAMRSGDPETIARVLGAVAGGRMVLKAMEGLLERWGHIGMVNTDFSSPSWRDEPGMLWHLASFPAPAVADRSGGGPAANTGLFARAVLRRRVRGLGRFMAARDDVNDLLAQTYDAWRRSVRAAGRTLTSQVLGDPGLVHYLRLDEMLAALDGHAPSNLASVACERATAHAADAHLSPPHRLWDLRLPPRGRMASAEHELAHPGDVLRGVGASAGVVRGRARVVSGFADVAAVSPGDILVVGAADIGWTPFLAVVSGVVTAAGGMLSHAAVVARELGIPAVLAVEDADLLIADGAVISIDGTEGFVMLLDRGDKEVADPRREGGHG